MMVMLGRTIFNKKYVEVVASLLGLDIYISCVNIICICHSHLTCTCDMTHLHVWHGFTSNACGTIHVTYTHV